MLETEYNSLCKKLIKFKENFIEIKVDVHSIEKLGVDVKKYYKLIDNIGIAMYQLQEFYAKDVEERLGIEGLKF